ncbi:hypothetical protein DL96DRAFT_1578514 [Flagelloscypha sp. PMI_526]|nr:hypothetical protein DL96DRAFT_1578514 [Flagelloscypha sp. PMI_526]
MATPQDVPRLFLQAVLSRRVLSSDLARIIWRKSIETIQEASETDIDIPDNDKSWVEFLRDVNDSLNDLDLEFRQFRDEEEGRAWFGIVNRKGDDIAQAATNYSAAEIAYFKALVTQIMLAPRKAYSISSTAALREVNFVKGLTKLQAENVLDHFVANRWLNRSRRGRYSLSARTVLELESYLKTEFPDEVINCTVCRDMLTKGYACTTVGCKGRTHLHCLNVARGKCTECKEEWPKSSDVSKAKNPLIPIGEDAVKDNEAFNRVVREEEEDGAEPDVDDDMEGVEKGKGKGKMKKDKQSKLKVRKGKGKGRKTKTAEDSEVEASMSEHSDSD